MTKTLIEDTRRRYALSSRFLVETFMPNGLQRYSDGFKSAVHVRLLHARTRRRILQSGV